MFSATKKIALVIVALIFAALQIGFSQQTLKQRGVPNNSTDNVIPKGNTYALIIGINYKNRKKFDSLNFAVSDAKLFKAFLQSGEFVDSVDEKKIKIILDSQATSANLFDGVDWLEHIAKKNDRVIFYFAGHGITPKPRTAFLIAYDAPDIDNPGRYGYQGGAIPVQQLKETIADLRLKGVTTFLITDACRNNDPENPFQNNFQDIMEANEGEIQFSSCSRNQSSVEDKKWGGGHGLFTFYLIKGLNGEADREGDKNGEVSLSELQTYVTQHVRNESRDLITNKPKQEPYINLTNAVDHDETIAYVRPGKDLNKLLREGNNLAETKKRGFHDTTILFQQFHTALNNKLFFAEQKNNAFDLLTTIKSSYPQDEYNNEMQEYIIQLLNDAQIRINKYFEGIDTNYTNNYFARGARELTTALSFMSKDHPLYKVYTVNRLFMEARSLNGVNSEFPLANRKLDSAIALDSSVAYLYHVKGLYAEEDHKYADAIKYYKKARELNPDWTFPVYGLGNCYMNLGENQNAHDLYTSEIDRDSADVYSWNNLGLLYETRFKKTDSAMMCYKKAVSLDPRFVTGFRNIGYLYTDKYHDNKLALSYYKQALAIDSLDESTWNSLGLFYASEKKHDTAIAYYKKAISLNSYYVYSLRNLGSVYEELHNYPQALEYYKMATAADKLNSDSWNKLGVFYYNRRKYDSSIFYYKKAINISPDYTLSLRNIGSAYEAMHNDSLAIITYRQLLSVDPLNSDNWNQVGVFYFNRRRYDSAIYYYQKAIDHDPSYVLSMRNLGQVYEALHQNKEALSFFLRTIAIDSLNCDNWNQLGVFYQDQRKDNEALLSYRKALALDPSYLYGVRNSANAYEKLKDFPSAKKMYKQAISLNPFDEVSWNKLGNYYFGRQQYDSAIACYKKAVTINPLYGSAWLYLSQAYVKINNTQLARNACLQAIAGDSASADNWTELGVFYDGRRQYDSAIYCYQKSLTLDPGYCVAMRNIGLAYNKSGDQKNAMSYYRLAAATDSLSADNWNDLGDMYAGMVDKYDSAEYCFRKSLAADPENSLPIIKLASVYKSRGQKNEALNLYHQAIKTDPGNPANYNDLGVYYYDEKDNDTAIFYYKKALDIDPGYVMTLRNIGSAYLSLNQNKEALFYYYRGIRIDSANSGIWNGLGVYYDNKKNTDSAIKCYRKALSIAPSYTLAIQNLSTIYSRLNKKQDIINLYRRATEADSFNAVNWNKLGLLYDVSKKADSAVYCYKKAMMLSPQNSEYCRNLGYLYQRLDSDKLALAVYSKAINADSTNSDNWNYLGVFYNKIKRSDSAVIAYKRALVLDPKFVLAAKNLRLEYLALKREGEILPVMLRLTRADSANAETWWLAGNCYFTGSPDSAAWYYSKGIKVDSSFSANYRSMGMLSDNKKHYEDAIIYYGKSFRRDSLNEDALSRIGYDYLYTGKFPEAHRYFQKEIKIDSTNNEGYYDEACAYSRQKNAEKGLHYLQLALDKKFTDLDHIKQDEDLTYLKQLPQFKELLKKYFPDKNVD